MDNVIAVRVTDEVYARLREMAVAEERPIAFIVRRWIDAALKVQAGAPS
jgi:predicted DNA-binding protein